MKIHNEEPIPWSRAYLEAAEDARKQWDSLNQTFDEDYWSKKETGRDLDWWDEFKNL